MDTQVSSEQHVVAAITYDQLGTFEFGCVAELFGLSRPEVGPRWYELQVCAIEAGPLRAMGGIQFDAPFDLSILDRADTIVIPGWRNPNECPPQNLLAKLQAAYMRGARICSICSGAFFLAWAGLLDGKQATTHWRLADKLQSMFPLVDVVPDALYVDAGQLMTSGGSAAGLDMLLHLINKDHGGKVANLVAKRLLIQPHRHGTQAQLVARPVPPDEAGRMSKLVDWLRAHLNESHTLESMAHRAAMSKRTLQRQFFEATGLSPLEWLTLERVSLAKQLLEAPHTPIGLVGERSGFGSEEAFRRHFRKIASVSPAGYRRSFLSRQGAGADRLMPR